MSKNKVNSQDLDIYEDLKSKDEEFNTYETSDEQIKLSPLAIIYIAISLIAVIAVTLYGNGTSTGAELSWLRYVLCGQLFAGVGVIMFKKSRESSNKTKNQSSGVMLIVAGIIVVILGIIKRFI